MAIGFQAIQVNLTPVVAAVLCSYKVYTNALRRGAQKRPEGMCLIGSIHFFNAIEVKDPQAFPGVTAAAVKPLSGIDCPARGTFHSARVEVSGKREGSGFWGFVTWGRLG